MQHAEHGDAQADAEREDGRDRDGEEAIATQAAEAEAHVADAFAQPAPGPDVTAGLLRLVESTQFEPHAPPGVGVGHAAGHEVRDLALDVIAQLRVEALVGRRPAPCRPPVHDALPSAALKITAIASVRRCQLACSRSMWARPARVSR